MKPCSLEGKMTSQDGVAPITPTLRSSNHRMSWYTAEFKNLNPNIQECSPLLQEPGCTHPQQQPPILITASRAPRTSPLFNSSSGIFFRELRYAYTARAVLNDWPLGEAVAWRGFTRGQRALNSPSLPSLLQKHLEQAHGKAPSSPLLPSTPSILSSVFLIILALVLSFNPSLSVCRLRAPVNTIYGILSFSHIQTSLETE